MKKAKKYWHELPQQEVDEIFNKKVNVKYVLDNFKQPNWCDMAFALEGVFGCWSLVYFKRTQISEEFCKTCICFKK